MICYCCDQDNWHSLKELNPERELQVCKDCGNVAYKVDPADEERVKKYYRFEYRPMPTHENLMTTTRKLNYIKLFLSDFLKDKKGLTTGDVGCATGYIVSWFRQNGHRATGCELTLTYRRFTEHFYGIPIPEELETKHKYDLISLYHVFEHLITPDKKLAHYVSLLADGGHVFVSTPEWLDVLEEASGSNMSTFQHLFHKDHINVFSRQSLQNVFAKSGLVIVKEDHLQYGQTYLLTKGEPKPIVKENWEEIVTKIVAQNTAIDLYKQKKYKEATEVWPKFPEAWIRIAYEKHGKDPLAQKETFDEAHKVVGDNVRLAMAHANWFYQNQYFKEAYEQLEWIVRVKPNEEIYKIMGECLAMLGNQVGAMAHYQRAHELNPILWQGMMDRICKHASSLPAWDERAMAQAIEEASKSLPKPEFKDPTLEDAKAGV